MLEKERELHEHGFLVKSKVKAMSATIYIVLDLHVFDIIDGTFCLPFCIEVVSDCFLLNQVARANIIEIL